MSQWLSNNLEFAQWHHYATDCLTNIVLLYFAWIANDTVNLKPVIIQKNILKFGLTFSSRTRLFAEKPHNIGRCATIIEYTWAMSKQNLLAHRLYG